MPAYSEAFAELAKRVRLLGDQFLPPVSATGTYSPKQEQAIRAYLVLCHAEIESYFEFQAIRLYALMRSELAVREQARLNEPRSAAVLAQCRRAMRGYEDRVKSNNGVKKSNVLKLFEDFGIEENHLNELEPLLLDELEAFGKLRGGLVHQSLRRWRREQANNGLQTSLDAKDERVRVEELVKKLKVFDQAVEALRRTHFLR